jgi:hypothetical protein
VSDGASRERQLNDLTGRPCAGRSRRDQRDGDPGRCERRAVSRRPGRPSRSWEAISWIGPRQRPGDARQKGRRKGVRIAVAGLISTHNHAFQNPVRASATSRRLAHRRGRDPRDRRGNERRGDHTRRWPAASRVRSGRTTLLDFMVGLLANQRAVPRLPRLGRAACSAVRRELHHEASHRDPRTSREARSDQRARKRVRQRPRTPSALPAPGNPHDDHRGTDPRQGVRRRAGLDHDPPGGVRRGAHRGPRR